MVKSAFAYVNVLHVLMRELKILILCFNLGKPTVTLIVAGVILLLVISCHLCDDGQITH